MSSNRETYQLGLVTGMFLSCTVDHMKEVFTSVCRLLYFVLGTIPPTGTSCMSSYIFPCPEQSNISYHTGCYGRPYKRVSGDNANIPLFYYFLGFGNASGRAYRAERPWQCMMPTFPPPISTTSKFAPYRRQKSWALPASKERFIISRAPLTSSKTEEKCFSAGTRFTASIYAIFAPRLSLSFTRILL